MYDLYNEISDSLTNGQNKQAVEQFIALPHNAAREGCLVYFEHHLELPEQGLKISRLIFLNYDLHKRD